MTRPGGKLTIFPPAALALTVVVGTFNDRDDVEPG